MFDDIATSSPMHGWVSIFAIKGFVSEAVDREYPWALSGRLRSTTALFSDQLSRCDKPHVHLQALKLFHPAHSMAPI